MWLELGIQGQLFEAPTLLQEVVMELWLKHTWLATRQNNIHLIMDIPDFPLQQHGNKELVHTFLQHSVCQPQLEALHQCCMYLHILHLSYRHRRQAFNGKLVTISSNVFGIYLAKSRVPKCSRLGNLEQHPCNSFSGRSELKITTPAGTLFSTQGQWVVF